MEQTSIFVPVFVLLILTMLVWFYMYFKRIPFIRNNNLSPQELTPLEFQRLSPAEIANPSDNLKNLFEIPVLFYFLTLYLFVTNQVDQTYLVGAWAFVVFRIAHSLVHSTFNAIMLRFALYVMATLSVWFIVIRAALQLLS